MVSRVCAVRAADARLACILDAGETDSGVQLDVGFAGCRGGAGAIAAPQWSFHTEVPSSPAALGLHHLFR